jgi:hypothetical protein
VNELLNKATRGTSEKDNKVVENQFARYERARDNGHTDFMAEAKQCSDYYLGTQWAEADRQKLESEGKPVLTINMILSTVNAILGTNAANSSEFRFVPQAEGDEATSSVMTKLCEAIRDANKFQWLEQGAFSDGVIQGRAFLDLRMSFDKNLMGEVAIKAEDPLTILIDPDAKKYDPESWTEVFKTEWLSLDQVEALYGKPKVNEIKKAGLNLNSFGDDSIMWMERENTYGEIQNNDNTRSLQAISDDEERTIRQVRVIERQHIRMSPCKEFVDMVTGDTKLVPETWGEDKVKEFAATHQLGLIGRVRKKVRWTVTADRVLLHDGWSPYASFTIVPFFPYFQRGRPFGVVKNLISPQEQLNKLASQELAIINTTANSGWIMERGSLSGMTADDLRNQGAETGLVLEVNPGRSPPDKIQPNKVPMGIERAALKSADFLKEISGVNNAQLGTDSAEVSGVALKQKTMQGQVQLQVPFENLQRTRYMVAGKMLELVQQFYTEPRVFKVVTAGLNPATLDDKEKQYVINQKSASGEVINDITLGKYEISVSVVPSRDSFQDQQFAEALSLRNVGVMVPDDRIVEYSHLAHKEELADEIRQIQGRGEMSEEEQKMMQLQQQVQQQMMMLEVEKASAEVQKLQAEATVLMAEMDMNSPEYQIKKDEMDLELTIAREQLQLRRDLANLQSTNNMDVSSMKERSGIAQGNANNNLSLVQSREKNMTELRKQQDKLRSDSKGLDRKQESK